MTTDGPKRIKQLNTLIELSALINSSLDIAEIRKRAVEAATELVNTEAGSLLFLDEETGELYFDVAIGEKGEKVKTIRLKKGQGIAGRVAEHHRSLIINDVQSDSRFFKGADEKSGFVTKNMLCVPVKTKQKPIGVLQAINKKDAAFNNKDLDILTALSNQVAIAIENARLYDELQETFYATVHALAETIEKRDPYTGGHTKRVMDYSLAIGRIIGLSKKEMENLKLSAILHDIGKIGIRDDVLLKNDKLTSDEFKKMMMHTVFGAEILNHIRQLKDVVPGVKYHHEKYDGSGYPDGIKGDDAPIVARIIAVADTFDAMTTDRPYRKGMNFDAAFGELKKLAGSQFDPNVVNAFFKAYEEMEIAV
jgi:HD-GYP domain-containing protein (c-di-GMP phosphodiesterase class II)